jgi:hypothetical protein
MRIKGLEALYIESLIKLSSAFRDDKTLSRFDQHLLSENSRGMEVKIQELEIHDSSSNLRRRARSGHQ